MRFRNSLLAILLITIPFISIQSSQAKDPQVILDTLLTGDVPALNAKDLNIPSDLEPGFHQLEVQVYDDNGVISTQTALFCKDLKGELHFDNQCPDLVSIQSQRTNIPFNPAKNPDQTITFFAVAAAAFSTILGFRRREDFDSSNQMELPPDPPNLNSGDMHQVEVRRGWGDRRWYINQKIFNSFDDIPKRLALFFGKKFNLLGRIILDARYLRAIFGNLAWVLNIAAIVITYFGLLHINNAAVPMGVAFTTALIIIGIFDSFAGLLAALLYVNFIFANGNLNSVDISLFALFYTMLFFAPALLISKARKLHRAVNDYDSFWSRLGDYVIGSILVGWAITNIIGFLPSMFGFELPITQSAVPIGVLAGLATALRLLLEDFAWYLYPYGIKRLHVDLPSAGYFQKIRSIFTKTALFLLVVVPYIGWNKYLIAGLSLSLIPQLLGLFSHKFKKFTFTKFILPEGVLRIVTLAAIGILMQKYVIPQIKTNESVLLTSYVVLMVPSFLFSFTDLFAKKHKYKFTKIWSRFLQVIGSLLVLAILSLLVAKVNIPKAIEDFVNSPSNTWNDWTNSFAPWVQSQWSNFSDWIIQHFKK